MLDINPGLILWTILTFLVLLVVLKKIAWKPLLHALTSREEGIRVALQQADEAQKTARELLEENKKQLARSEEESQRIIREGRELGEKLKAEIIDRANSASRHMVDQAKEEIRREREAALLQLRSEVADLAILAAGKILDANLDGPKQRALVDGVLQDLEKGKRS
jgi:F-type H+-transporting ATPase subunit b